MTSVGMVVTLATHASLVGSSIRGTACIAVSTLLTELSFVFWGAGTSLHIGCILGIRNYACPGENNDTISTIYADNNYRNRAGGGAGGALAPPPPPTFLAD